MFKFWKPVMTDGDKSANDSSDNIHLKKNLINVDPDTHNASQEYITQP